MVKNTSSKILAAVCVFFIIFFAFAAMKEHSTIDPAKCTNCGECAAECPEEAISPGVVDGKEVHIIDIEKCTACGICIDICPEGAIYIDTTDIPGYVPEETKAKPDKKEKKKTKKVKKYKVK